jgi:predicted nuclease of restriction endonuclease-like (RecB) superfamily
MKPTKTSDYIAFLGDIKKRISTARLAAARKVNTQLISLYWDIGKDIVQRQRLLGWGEGVIDRLAKDLQQEYTETVGFSARNLRAIKGFYSEYSNKSIWQQAVAKLGSSAKT